jgi:hypothetical protein
MNNPNTNTSSLGAALEMIVCADLLLRGLAVFRSVSPACSCDLVILLDGRLLRIEVTAGSISRTSGKLAFSFHDPANYDTIAVVLPDKSISMENRRGACLLQAGRGIAAPRR